MTLSHSTQLQHKQEKQTNPLNAITEFVDKIHTVQEQFSSFEQVEKTIKGLVVELENSLVQESLSQYDINTPIVEMNGEIYHQALRQEKIYTCSSGKITVERSLYRKKVGEPCICPMEFQAGIIEDFWTPSAARLGCYVTAQLSPYQGEKLFKEFGHLTPSKSSLTRLSTKLGETWDLNHAQLEQALCQEIIVPKDAVTVSASLDGIMLPLNKKTSNGYQAPEKVSEPTEDEAKELQRLKDKAFYREASCAALAFYDKEGERLETLRFGRMPEAGKKTLKSMIAQSMASITAQSPNINVVKIADGAKDNWRFLSDDLLPKKGTELLDYFHASGHLSQAFEAAYEKNSPKAIAQYLKYRSLLKTEVGGIEKVIVALRYLSKKHPTNKNLKVELAYFRNNRHRMKYAQATENNFPIGSGITESACKTLVTQRLKCAGMRWDLNGGQGVLTARSLIQSKCFDKGWDLLSMQYLKKITLPENVVAFKKI